MATARGNLGNLGCCKYSLKTKLICCLLPESSFLNVGIHLFLNHGIFVSMRNLIVSASAKANKLPPECMAFQEIINEWDEQERVAQEKAEQDSSLYRYRSRNSKTALSEEEEEEWEFRKQFPLHEKVRVCFGMNCLDIARTQARAPFQWFCDLFTVSSYNRSSYLFS